MDFILQREHWTSKDITEFEELLLSQSKGKEKAEWERRIVNTNLPCLAVPAPMVKQISAEIFKGNYVEFLEHWPYNNFTDTSILGGIICRIKDFALFEQYLNKYAELCDNWATCDLLKFNINEKNKDQFLILSNKYIASSKPFVRRIGIKILFKFVDDNCIIDHIFNVLNSFENEEEYYVNMCLAWLFAECFTKQRDKTINFLKTNRMNKFVIKKGVQKCRDSFRISKEDKKMLSKLILK